MIGALTGQLKCADAAINVYRLTLNQSRSGMVICRALGIGPRICTVPLEMWPENLIPPKQSFS